MWHACHVSNQPVGPIFHEARAQFLETASINEVESLLCSGSCVIEAELAAGAAALRGRRARPSESRAEPGPCHQPAVVNCDERDVGGTNSLPNSKVTPPRNSTSISLLLVSVPSSMNRSTLGISITTNGDGMMVQIGTDVKPKRGRNRTITRVGPAPGRPRTCVLMRI